MRSLSNQSVLWSQLKFFFLIFWVVQGSSLEKSVNASSVRTSDQAQSAYSSSPGVPKELQGIGITEHLGAQVSIQELVFKDEAGNSVHLSDYFEEGVPVLLALVYYECPNLCNFMLNGLINSLKTFEWTPGKKDKKFQVVIVSIHPQETPDLARRKKEAYIRAYNRPEAAEGMHFLTGDFPQIQKLASEIGFAYRYDDKEKQYAHSSAMYVLTPRGKISRYLWGIEYPNKDLRLAFLEASNGKVGTVVDRILLFCYRYDPQTRKYSVYSTRLMQAGCGGTVLALGSYFVIFWHRQRKKEPNSNV